MSAYFVAKDLAAYLEVTLTLALKGLFLSISTGDDVFGRLHRGLWLRQRQPDPSALWH